MLAVVLFGLNVYWNAPLFRDGAQPYRGSIESGYAGIARVFADHPNPWGWNPLIYCGVPTHHTYLPGHPYAVASLLWLRPQMEPLHAYRMVSALLACLGPSTLFLFAWYATRSKWWAFAAALAYTTCSPSYELFETIDADRGLLPIPWRLHVMLKYGEGPHNAGLMLIPLALLAVMAARTGGFVRIFLAAITLAAVALTHWIAALALAICCIVLMLSQPFGIRRIAAAGVLAYGLACFWLTPTFVQTVAFNWPKDSFNFQMQARQRVALLLIVVGAALLLAAFRWFPQYRYLCFVSVCFFVFAGFAEGHYAYKVDPIPEARRYAVEMELFLVLAVAEWLRVGWKAGGGVNRFCVAMVLALLVAQGVPQAKRFVREGYRNYQLRPKEQTVEYQLAQWLAQRMPQGRVFVSGGLRFRLNSWFDVAQTTGTFESGLLNRTPLDYEYRFRTLTGAEAGKEQDHWRRSLMALGVEYLVVHGPESKEYYRDTKDPGRFEGVLERVYDAGGDWVYRVPFRSLAHGLRPTEQPLTWDPAYLERYEHALLDPARATLSYQALGTNRIWIQGPALEPSMQVQVMTSYDSGWRATQDGEELPVSRDKLGYLLVRPKEGQPVDIRLEYGPTAERIWCAGVSLLAWLGAVGWSVVVRRRSLVGNRVAAIGI